MIEYDPGQYLDCYRCPQLRMVWLSCEGDTQVTCWEHICHANWEIKISLELYKLNVMLWISSVQWTCGNISGWQGMAGEGDLHPMAGSKISLQNIIIEYMFLRLLITNSMFKDMPSKHHDWWHGLKVVDIKMYVQKYFFITSWNALKAVDNKLHVQKYAFKTSWLMDDIIYGSKFNFSTWVPHILHNKYPLVRTFVESNILLSNLSKNLIWSFGPPKEVGPIKRGLDKMQV